MAVEGVADQNVSSDSTATSQQSDTTTQQTASQQTTQQTSQTGRTGADNTGEWEKQRQGFLADVKRERQRAQQAEARVKQYEADLASERKRIQALAGVAPQSPQDAEAEAVKARFKQLYPELAEFSKEDLQAIRDFKQRQADLQETTNHYWRTHATKMTGDVVSAVEKEIGGKLTDRQRARLERAYGDEVGNNETYLQRHASGDKTLTEQFAKECAEDWFAPARRGMIKQEAQRFRPVPDGKGRGIVTQGEKKIDVNDPKAVEDMLVRGFKERGGEFGRR